MLKWIRRLCLVAVIAAANMCAAPVHATSATVLISHIQAGGAGAASQELIILYNNSDEDVDVSRWCVRGKSLLDIACFLPDSLSERHILPARSHAIIASISFMAAHPQLEVAVGYQPLNPSTGAIIGSADTISLFDASGTLIDSHQWTNLAGGSVLVRKEQGIGLVDTDSASDWSVVSLPPLPENALRRVFGPTDLCPNIDGFQEELPTGLIHRPNGNCLPPPAPLIITELLPNASGSDVGREYIELHNPGDVEVDLSDYVMEVGLEFERSYSFPSGAVIGPQSYIVFDNAVIPYSLLNTSSRVRLVTADGIIIDETPAYVDPKDDRAWSLIDGAWQYSIPTPGEPNVLGAGQQPLPLAATTTTLKPCAANQYRSPDTNRCRTIAVAAVPTPCKEGQHRSEETNRCRNITTAKTVTPCKEGQERNPDTNRCRTIVKMKDADYKVLGTSTKSEGTGYMLAAIVGLLLVGLAYAVWEWRWELGRAWARIRKFVRIRK